jgi:hypothetical protein
MYAVLRVVVIASAVLALAPVPRAAAQGVPHHANVHVAPLKEHGQVVGAKISMTLKTNGPRFVRARVGLLDKAGAVSLRGNRGQLGDMPQLFHFQFEPVTVPVEGPIEATLELRYGKGNSFKGGEKVALISRWPTTENANLLHVWGDSQPLEIDLPK